MHTQDKFILLFAFLCWTGTANAQKGTDHDKFARKFYQNYSYSEDKIEGMLPDKTALSFISAKTGESVEKLEARMTDRKKELKKELYNLGMKGQNKKNSIDDSRITVLQESPIKLADIYLSTHWGQEKFTFLLHNCVQTDQGWYLGDFVGLEGESRGGQQDEKYKAKREQITVWLADNSKDYTTLKNVRWNCIQVFGEYSNIPFYSALLKSKLPDSSALELPQFKLLENGKLEGKWVAASGPGERFIGSSWKQEGDKLLFAGEQATEFTIQHASPQRLVLKDARNFYFDFKSPTESSEPAVVKSGEIKPWIGPSFPMQNAEPYTQYIKKDLIGKPIRSYFITPKGQKIVAAIKYQEPEYLCSASSTLLLYNIAYGEPGFTEDESNNLYKALMKDSVVAFYLVEQIFVPVKAPVKQWGILRSEGAIRQVVLISKVVSGGKTGYAVSTIFDKLDGPKVNVASMTLSFKNSMADLVADYKELADKVRNKQEGYRLMQVEKIIEEYNKWFDQQNPGKVKYLFYSDGSVAYR